MTKKHYIKVAKIISEIKSHEAITLHKYFELFFSEDNPHFDKKKFKEACKLDV